MTKRIEDRWAALAAKATQEMACIDGQYTQEMSTEDGKTIASFWERFDDGSVFRIENALLCSTEESEANAALHVALHNAVTPIIAVVRAARKAADSLAKIPRADRFAASRYNSLRAALCALDAVNLSPDKGATS